MSDGVYDPNAAEGEKPQGQQYVTKKDLRVLAAFGLLFAPAAFFGYRIFKGSSDRHVCTSNLAAIYKAVNLYAEQHDNRFPPLARTQVDGLTPDLDAQGRPYTWISDTSPFLGARQSFVCPASTDAERVANESGESATASVLSSYGMYAPYGGVLTSNVETPDDVVILAETSNLGALGALDPKTFGANVPDGFVIGWSDTNTDPGKATERVTRLAFPNGKEGRHGGYSQAISASGQLISLVPDDAVFHAGGGINPHWKLPPGYRPAGK